MVPFGYEGFEALPEDIAQIVESDLARSGLFQPVPRSNMLSMPSKEADVFYRDWRLLKSDYVVIGSVQKLPNNQYRIGFELLNVLSQKPVQKHSSIDVSSRNLGMLLTTLATKFTSC